MLADPVSPGHDRPLDRWYEFEISLRDSEGVVRIGEHAWARFDLGGEPIVWRIARGTQQVLSRTLNL
jgi:hypothetical protein